LSGGSGNDSIYAGKVDDLVDGVWARIGCRVPTGTTSIFSIPWAIRLRARDTIGRIPTMSLVPA
jgi:hypothetical protein